VIFHLHERVDQAASREQRRVGDVRSSQVIVRVGVEPAVQIGDLAVEIGGDLVCPRHGDTARSQRLPTQRDRFPEALPMRQTAQLHACGIDALHGAGAQPGDRAVLLVRPLQASQAEHGSVAAGVQLDDGADLIVVDKPQRRGD
jgi:hypothetical protein